MPTAKRPPSRKAAGALRCQSRACRAEDQAGARIKRPRDLGQILPQQRFAARQRDHDGAQLLQFARQILRAASGISSWLRPAL